MFKQTRKVLIAGLPFFSSDDSDPYTLTEAAIQKRLKDFEASFPVSGWERVKFALLSKDEYGDRSPYVASILQYTLAGGMAGCFYGGYKKSQTAYSDFLRTNQATAFLTHHEAKKSLQDKIFISFMKGGLQLGWRTSLFSFMFMSVSNCVAIYRNKDGIIEYSAAGAVAGTTYRTHVGVRGMIVGGILGLTLGTAAGVFSNTLFWLTGYSMTDVRNAQYAFAAYRQSVDKRGDDKGQRIDQDEPSEMLQRIERDEKAGRLEDNLQQIEVTHTVQSKVDSKLKTNVEVHPASESKR